MPKKRFSAEQIVTLLRQIEVLWALCCRVVQHQQTALSAQL
jgi:hypothetical protein